MGFKTWYSKYITDDRIDRCADSFTGWALSTTADEVSADEVFGILTNVVKRGGPGIVVGGCSSITNELLRIISECSGNVHAETEVTKIIIKDGKAVGATAGGKDVYADLVISDIGHKEAWELCEFDGTADPASASASKSALPEYEAYIEKLSMMKPSAGLKICFSSDESLLPDNCSLMLTPYANRINGLNEVTKADSNLAPPGKHLFLCHQRTALDKLGEADIEKEIELGLEDVRDMFPGKEVEILMVQVHSGRWPVNRAFSGSDFGNSTPVSNLIVVGDGAKGDGGIEIEGITFGVQNALKLIQKLDD